MPCGEYLLRDPAPDVRGNLHPAGPVDCWYPFDSDWAFYWRPDLPAAYREADLVGLMRRSGDRLPGKGGIPFRKADINLALILRADISASSQAFVVKDMREVDILIASGARLRYRVGSPSERAERTAGGDGLSTLIVSTGAVVEVPIPPGNVLHLTTDAAQAGVVPAELRCVLFHPD